MVHLITYLSNGIDRTELSLILNISSNIQAIAFTSVTFIVSLFHFVTSAAFSLIIIDHRGGSLSRFFDSLYRQISLKRNCIIISQYNAYNSNA